MLSEFSGKTFLINCNDCGFRYMVLQTSAAHPVCPCCGAEKPPESVEDYPAEKTSICPPDTLLLNSGANVFTNQVLPNRNGERWGILFISVCLQWVIILVSPFYIYYQLQKQEPDNRSGTAMKSADSEIKSGTKNEIETFSNIPAAALPINPFPVQQKPELNIEIKPVHPAFAEQIITEPAAGITEQIIKEPPENTVQAKVIESAFSAPPLPQTVPAPAVPLPATMGNVVENNFKTENNIRNVKKIESKESVSQYKARLTQAEKNLEYVSSLIPISPESALDKGIETVQLFRQLGQNVPASAYWLISQAFASQGWGRPLAEHTLPVVSMDISSDSRWLLSQNEKHSVMIQDIVQRDPQTDDAVNNAVDTGGVPFVKLLFTSDNRFIIGNTEDGTISIWDTTQKKPAETVKILKTALRHPVDLQISPDGKWLACCCSSENSSTGEIDTGSGQNGTEQNGDAVELWNISQLPKGTVPQFILLRGHEKPIRSMVFSPDSGSLITGSDDSAARIYDLKSAFPGACQAVLKGHKDGITALAVAPNGKWLATGSRDQTIRLWSLTGETYEPVSVILTGHIGWISALVIDNNSERLISGSYDRTIRLWNIPQGDIRKVKNFESIEIPNDQGTVCKMFLSKDGRILVSLGSDASLRLRELSRGIGGEQNPKNTLMLRNKMLPIQQVMLTPDDRYLIFSYLNLNNEPDSGIRIWPLHLDNLLKDIKN